jgi:signal transduction histidine kinase
MKKEPCEFCRHHFLAVLSHELRNPLAATSNSLYVLKRCQPEDPRGTRAVAVMERQIRQMAALIDGLTEVADLGRGGLLLHRSQVDLVELLHHACLDHEHLFERRELELREELPDEVPPVLADPARLTQVIGNLLENAVKFTPPGGRVVVRLDDDQAAEVLRVRVQDSGVGLAAGLRERLFEPFARADTLLTSDAGGLGIGLAVVKGIVELHGGSVGAESEGPGQGTTFIVELPRTARMEQTTGDGKNTKSR